MEMIDYATMMAGPRTKMVAGMGMKIPVKDQNMAMEKNGDKWKYKVKVLEEDYKLMNPTDDFVRMFANTKLSAKEKDEYIRMAMDYMKRKTTDSFWNTVKERGKNTLARGLDAYGIRIKGFKPSDGMSNEDQYDALWEQ